MQIHLINLERDTDRLRQFHQRNPHIRDVVRPIAIEGKFLDREKLVRDGLMTPDLDYTRGALGNAISHIENWRMAVDQNKFITTVEDDAIFSNTFEMQTQWVLKLLPVDWDIILWGWNFDAFLFIDLLPGVSAAKVECYQDQMRQNIEQFQNLETSPVPVRLLHCFGIMCYTISPKGARALFDICLPLRRTFIEFPGLCIRIENKTIDAMMNAAYPSLRAFVCIPPLVVSENRHEASTIVGQP